MGGVNFLTIYLVTRINTAKQNLILLYYTIVMVISSTCLLQYAATDARYKFMVMNTRFATIEPTHHGILCVVSCNESNTPAWSI